MLRLFLVAYKPSMLVLALFLILPLSACKPSQQSGKVTIRFAYPGQFSPDPAVNQALADRYKALADAFHAQNPQYTVKLVPLTWEQLSAITAKDYDVLLNNNFSGYVERGDLRSMTPWISLEDKAWIADYLPTVLKPFERKGEVWTLPWGLDPVILFYNKDLFNRYGVEVPQEGWTWSDFLEKANALTDAENGVYGSVILNQYDLVPAIIYQHGGQLFDDWSQPTLVTLDDPRNVEALSWLQSLIYEYKVIPTRVDAIRMFGAGTVNVFSGINKGKFGMWATQYILAGGALWGAESEWTVPWGAVPQPRDAQAATTVTAYQLGISSQAADADACWRWIEYMSHQLPPSIFLPARTSLRESFHTENSSSQEAFDAGSAALEGILLISTGAYDESIMPASDAFWAAVEAILYKGETAEEQLRLAQEKAPQ